MAIRRVLGSGGGLSYSSGGTTNNVIPKADGSGGLKDSALTDNGTTVTSTEFVIVPSTNSATVAGGIGSATNEGINFNGTSNIQFINGGARQVGITTTAIALSTGHLLGWSNTGSDALGTAVDTNIRKRSAANIALGATDVNGAPVAQTISVQNAITGSNLPAANTTVDLGLGTGTGLTGTFIVRGGDSSVATGTTAQTNIIRCVLNATKALTSGAATTLVSIPLASLQMTGGYISVYMEATDGTNQATRAEEIYYAGENSAGVFVTSTGVVGTGVTACTAAKTLTATYALTGANPALLQVTPTLTGITATRFTCIYQVHHMGNTQPTI